MSCYQNRLLTEGIRAIEKLPEKEAFVAQYSSLSLQEAIAKRTKLAELRYQIQPVFDHFQYLLKLLTGLMALLFFIIGATGVTQLLVNEQGTQINFFWMLILFIVPNLFSLGLWLLLYFKTRLVSLSWLANLCLSCISVMDRFHHKVTNKHAHYSTLFKCYFAHRFSGFLGKSQLSLISHICWASYLLGATLSVVVVLATHQVDFIWQTTILNEQVFLSLTSLLTYLPNLLSIHVPSANDVLHANLGVVNSLSDAQSLRVSWSNLLLFSLTVYALLPRLLLMFYFTYRLSILKQQFRLDLSAPYYVQLKSILHPIAQAPFIKDADEQSVKAQVVTDTSHCKNADSVTLPEQLYRIAIELNTARYQQALIHSGLAKKELANLLDGEVQQQVINTIQTQSIQQILLYVDIQRTPDRGWLSFVRQCQLDENSQIFVVLLGGKDLTNEKLSKRLTMWCEKAAQVNIQQTHISYLLQS